MFVVKLMPIQLKIFDLVGHTIIHGTCHRYVMFDMVNTYQLKIQNIDWMTERLTDWEYSCICPKSRLNSWNVFYYFRSVSQFQFIIFIFEIESIEWQVLNSRITSNGLVSTMTYLAPTDSELTLACWASNAVGRQEIPCLIHILPASMYWFFSFISY